MAGLIFALTFLFISVTAEKSGFWKLELSPETFTSVPFGSGELTVWSHAENDAQTDPKAKVYFVMPLVYLEPNSTHVVSSIFTSSVSVQFKIIMYNSMVENAVIMHLRQLTGQNITSAQVRILPLEKVRLAWKDETQKVSPKYKIPITWRSFTGLPQNMKFSITCEDKPSCNLLAAAIREHPSDMSNLEMEFILNGQSSLRKIISVKGEHISKGDLFKRLLQMQGVNGDIRFLKPDDVKLLSSETYVKVVAETITDHGYVNKEDENIVQNMISAYIKSTMVSTNNFTPQMWKSVFWYPVDQRPDKVSSKLNALVKFQDNMFSCSEGSTDPLLEGLFGPDSRSVSLDDLKAWLSKFHSFVSWNGNSFGVEIMKLYRLNLAALTSATTIVNRAAQVHRYQAIHSTPVKTDMINLRKEYENTGQNQMFMALDAIKAEQNKLKNGIEVFKSNVSSQLNSMNESNTFEFIRVRNRIDRLEAKVANTSFPTKNEEKLFDRCPDYYDTSRIVKLRVELFPGYKTVYCDSDGWLVLMRRKDGSVNFTKNYEEYSSGFGNLDGEFWIGNDAMHALTSKRSYRIRFAMWYANGTYRQAEYRKFKIGPRSDGYRLTVGGYSGNATRGDWLQRLNSPYSHNNMKFTTYDHDADNYGSNCASSEKYRGGGWWYNACTSVLFTGSYHILNGRSGVSWHCCAAQYKIKIAEMKIRPN